MLKDKAKEDFFEWLYSEYDYSYNDYIQLYPKILRFSLIIEWMDLNFIIISITSEYYDGYHYQWDINMVKPEKSINGYDTRYKAMKSAIQRANEIYNSK